MISSLTTSFFTDSLVKEAKPEYVRSYTRVDDGKKVEVRAYTRDASEGPHSLVFKPIPAAKDQVWELGIHDHRALRAGKHYDLRLGDPTGDAHSWALRELPAPGKTAVAHQTFTHKREYMDFVGRLKGYGAGDVFLHKRTKAFIHYSAPDRILFSIVDGRSTVDYALIRVQEKTWLLHNISTPEESIPRGKESYHEIMFNNQLIDKLGDAPITPKLDGAHAIILLRPNKRIRAYSHRVSKTNDLLEYTHKIDGLFNAKYTGTVPLALSGEVVGVDKSGKLIPPEQLSGLLNATVLNSKQMQKEQGIKLQVYLFDTKSMSGKSTTPSYTSRHKLLTAISSKYPVLKVVPMATTKEDKLKMLDGIQSGKHPLTKEGIVAWTDKGPTKAKIVQDFDVYIRDIFPGEGKYKGKAAGGFSYSLTPDGPIVGKVGTGFVDSLRQEMWQQPKKFLGKVAKITALGKYPSGAYAKPSFTGLHIDKNIEV